MILKYTKSYDNTLKKIKRNHDALSSLYEILDYIECTSTFHDLERNPLSKIYNFERLKYENNNFYSFRLSKTIRLIVKQSCCSNCCLELCYISRKHYDDFSKEKVIYYEEE